MQSKSFTELSDEEIALFTESHCAEFGEAAVNPNFIKNLLTSINSGRAVIVRRHFGYAILHTRNWIESTQLTLLECMYILQEYRGTGTGTKFLEEIKKIYGFDCNIVLSCYGERRREFFRRAGFNETHKNLERFSMTYTK